MSYQAFLVCQLPINYTFLLFVFFGSLSSYNFHWYFTPFHTATSPKLRWSHGHRKVQVLLFVIGTIGAAYYTWQLREHWLWLLFTAVFTFLYSAPKIPHPLFQQLKKIAVGKTIFLAMAWMHITTMLPVIISTNNTGIFFETFAVNRFFFLYAICILFDYRDRHYDQTEGIRSMVTNLPESGVNLLFWGSIFITCTSQAYLYYLHLPGFTTLLFYIPVLLLCLLYSSSKKSTSDYRYYFVLDGLMMLSGLLLLIFSFK